MALNWFCDLNGEGNQNRGHIHGCDIANYKTKVTRCFVRWDLVQLKLKCPDSTGCAQANTQGHIVRDLMYELDY